MFNIFLLFVFIVFVKKFHVLAFFYWIYKDLIKSVSNKRQGIVNNHLYGIFGFFGLPGAGKTIALTWELENLRKKYGNDIYIFTNYGFKQEDKPFSHWQMLLETYDKPSVFAWDEVQNEFNSRDFKNFPVELLTLLTQNRKGNGKRIYYTAQRWGRVDKVFRELTFKCAECRTTSGRLTRLRWFDWEDYEMLNQITNVNQKMKLRPKVQRFIQTDNLRELYDSYQMLESAKSKQYMSRDEISTINM